VVQQKEEDKRALEKLREELAKDKAERLSRMGKGTGAAQPAPAPAAAPAQPVAAKPATEYTECILQIRLPNGSMLKETFKPTFVSSRATSRSLSFSFYCIVIDRDCVTRSDTIRTVIERVEKVKTDGFYPFQLMTTFPRKTYTPDLINRTLAEERTCFDPFLLCSFLSSGRRTILSLLTSSFAELAPRGTMVVTKTN
jgi:hypothetical protein